MRKVFYSLLIILVSGLFFWEYKVNVIVWMMPKVMNLINPVQENRPTSWQRVPPKILISTTQGQTLF